MSCWVGFVLIIDSESQLCASVHPRDVKQLGVLNYLPNHRSTLLAFPLFRASTTVSKITHINTHISHLTGKQNPTHHILKQTCLILLETLERQEQGKTQPLR